MTPAWSSSRAHRNRSLVQLQQTECRAGNEVPLVLRIGLRFGVSIMRTSQVVMFGEHDPAELFAVSLQAHQAPLMTGIQVQSDPAWIVAS